MFLTWSPNPWCISPLAFLPWPLNQQKPVYLIKLPSSISDDGRGKKSRFRRDSFSALAYAEPSLLEWCKAKPHYQPISQVQSRWHRKFCWIQVMFPILHIYQNLRDQTFAFNNSLLPISKYPTSVVVSILRLTSSFKSCPLIRHT